MKTINYILLFLLGNLNFFVSNITFANEAPRLLQASVEPQRALVGEHIVVDTFWEDLEGDFIVQTSIRYCKRGSSDCETIIMPWIPEDIGKNKARFAKTFKINEPGIYDCQFWAADERPLHNRIHSFDELFWQGEETLEILSSKPIGGSGETPLLERLNVYVWNFSIRTGEQNELTKQLTHEFEASLVSISASNNCCIVLERRQYDRLMMHKENEKSIMDVAGVSTENIEAFKTIKADAVIFGEVYDDVESGQISVTAIVQKFNGRTIASESVEFLRGKRFDAESRRLYMEKLVTQLCLFLRE